MYMYVNTHSVIYKLHGNQKSKTYNRCAHTHTHTQSTKNTEQNTQKKRKNKDKGTKRTMKTIRKQ